MLLSTLVGPAVPGGGRQQQWASPHWSHIWKGRLGCSCRLSERLPPGAGQRQKRMSCRGFLGLQCYLNRAQTLRTSQPLPKPQSLTWKPTYSFSPTSTVFLPSSIPLNSHLLTGSGRGLEEGDMLQLPGKLRDSKQPKAGPRDGQISHKGWSKGRHQGGSEGDPGGAALAEPVPELETNQCPAKPLTAHSPVSLGAGGLLTKWRLKGLTSLTRAHLAAALVFSSWCSTTQEASCR